MQSKKCTFRLEQEKFKNLSTDADKQGIKLSELIRHKLGFENKSETKRIMFLLNKTNNNINQIAKGFNVAHSMNLINDATYTHALINVATVKNNFKNIYNLIEENKNAN